MRVLHVFNEINFSGAEIMYANAAPLFTDRGIELVALSTGKNVGDYKHEFERNNISILHRPLLESNVNPVFLYKYFRNIIKLIKVEGIDVIHIHRSTFFWFFALCGFITGKRTVRTLHNVFKSGKITWIKAYVERLTARKIFKVRFQSISNSVYENERTYYKNRSITVNNWFDNKRFYPAVDESEIHSKRQQLAIDDNVFVICTAGRCTAEKRHKDIIEAIALVRKELPCVFLHLGSGCLEKEEKELANRLSLDSAVFFYGNVNNVRDYLIASDVFIMPSIFEGLGNSAIEAMACKIPNILYNSPGLKDLIKNDDNGFLIDHDPKCIADRILQFSRDKQLIQDKGSSALQFVNDNFSIESGVREIIKLYEQ